jgi:hypothetical protein
MQFPNAQWIPEFDTAASAHTVRLLGDPTHAAIAPHAAGKAAGLKRLVEDGLQDRKKNVTSFYMLGTGRHTTLPKNSTVTVAVLYRLEREGAEMGLRREVESGTVTLVHEPDIHARHMIVELHSGGDHVGAIQKLQSALREMYRVTFVGGYAPLSAAA